MFNVGDKVISPSFGKGVVTKVEENSIVVKLENGAEIQADIQSTSFKKVEKHNIVEKFRNSIVHSDTQSTDFNQCDNIENHNNSTAEDFGCYETKINDNADGNDTKNEQTYKPNATSNNTQAKGKAFSVYNNISLAGWIVAVVVGIILLIIGLDIELPPKELSYYSYNDTTYEIEEYVGGDAYNYIIGASQWAGEYSAKMTEKTLYICFGASLIVIGAIIYSVRPRN